MHNAARERAIDVANRLLAAIDTDVQRSIESIGLSLQAVVDGLKRSDIDSLAPDLRQAVLFDRSASARHLGLIIVTDKFGNLRFNSQTTYSERLSFADRDYFQVHKNSDGLGLYIGRPFFGRLTGQQSIGISRRLSDTDGSFAGVAVASLQLQYLKRLFADVSLGPESNVTLSGTDGTVIMRWPYDPKFIGRNIKSAELYKRLADSNTGHFETTAAIDGVHRLVAYKKIGDLPLVIGVGQSTNEIYSQWRKYAFVLWILVAILFTFIVILIFYLAREFRQRAQYEAKLAAALKNMPQGVCMFDKDMRLVVCNELYAKLYGLPPGLLTPGTSQQEIDAHHLRTNVLKGDADRNVGAQERPSALLPAPMDSRSVRIDEHSDGKLIRVTREPIEGGGWVATHDDITEQRRAELELEDTKQFLDSIISNIPNAIVVKDAKTRQFVLTNAAYEAMVGFSKAELIGKTAFDIYRTQDAELMDKSDSESLLETVGVKLNEYEVDTPLTGSRIISTKRIVVRDGRARPKYLIVVIEDVTDQKKFEHEIAFMAHHDALTGLANRTAITQKIEEAAARQRRFGDPFTVLLMDLDRFKHVNDTLGHHAGDALLREVAARLKAILRETDLLARLGGDEFAIIQFGDANPREAASALAGRIIKMLAERFIIEGNEVNIGTSIGVALAPEHGTNSDILLKTADMALYRAKSAGRNDYRFYDQDMGAAASARQELENELRRAIQQGEFEVHYQPIIETKSGKICGAEALARWKHPIKGLIFPDQFIPIAEETGLIVQISELVLQAACTEAANWPSTVKVAVNLSPVHFRKSNLPDVVMYALAQSGLPPERLELEITETALIESAADCLPALRQFKNLGISIALDDFGTGYSSLSQLTMFPFDKIKIDKSFTQNMTKRTDCAAIISATLTLAQSLCIATTAEGVETVEQYRLLRLVGVTSLQGHLFNSAKPASEINFDAAYIIQDVDAA
jgi:diguanylate cyclase (GGDEF)-like protein/PAS domain S-box-containing protein